MGARGTIKFDVTASDKYIRIEFDVESEDDSVNNGWVPIEDQKPKSSQVQRTGWRALRNFLSYV